MVNIFISSFINSLLTYLCWPPCTTTLYTLHINYTVCFKSSWQKQSQEIIIFLKHSLKSEYLQIFFFPSHDLSSFPFFHLTAHFNFWFNNLFCLFIFLWFLIFFIIDLDGYYIVRTDEGQPKPKYMFNKMWN